MQDIFKYSSMKTALLHDNLYQITDMIEKPKDESQVFSLFSILGRCVLPAKIFDILETLPKGAGGEYQLTDAMKILAQQEGMIGHRPAVRRRSHCRQALSYDRRHSELRQNICGSVNRQPYRHKLMQSPGNFRFGYFRRVRGDFLQSERAIQKHLRPQTIHRKLPQTALGKRHFTYGGLSSLSGYRQLRR